MREVISAKVYLRWEGPGVVACVAPVGVAVVFTEALGWDCEGVVGAVLSLSMRRVVLRLRLVGRARDDMQLMRVVKESGLAGDVLLLRRSCETSLELELRAAILFVCEEQACVASLTKSYEIL